ncbi:MAG: class I SAM-dependent methyltransferase [Nitrososphaerota archaeon]|nr:methyltransferase domain-containing protein [Candidatus Calditenuaceae archaeon]MDW8073508.1 class I SAM-dependent methyltransferase [Nitrososphaerota archaeon]
MRLLPLEPHRFRQYKAELVGEHTRGVGRVLEVGCGLRHYERYCGGLEYVGLDVNLSMRPSVVASAERLPFRDCCFEVVFMLDVLEHVGDVEAALRECVRVLRRGGRLLVTTPNTTGFGFYDSFADRTHLHHFSWRGLEEILRKSGLSVERRIPLHLHIFWPIRSRLLMPLQQSICLVARR